MKKIMFAFPLLLVSLFLSRPAQAAVLGEFQANFIDEGLTFDVPVAAGGLDIYIEAFDFFPGVPSRPAPPNITGRLFDALVIGGADEGAMFSATSATDPVFDEFVARLTDGFGGGIRNVMDAAAGPTLADSEANYFAGDPGVTNGIDFEGATINELKLTVDGYGVTPHPGAAHLEILTINYTVQILGEFAPGTGPSDSTAVPEPSTMILTGLGLAFAGLRKKFKK